MANGFNGVSQAEALFDIMRAGYHPMGLPVQNSADDSWHCLAIKQAAMNAGAVDRSGEVTGRQI